MEYDQFVGEVQNKARLGTEGQAVAAIRATLQTLAERLHGNEAQHLAAQLPHEVGEYMRMDHRKEAFDLDEFIERVSIREEIERPQAVHHARAVFEVVVDAVTPGEMDHVLDQLPQEYHRLILSGSEGDLDIPSA